MESIPPAKNTDWIEQSVWELNGHSKIEFLINRRIEGLDFKLALNCSSSCWRGMVSNTDEIVLAVRGYEDNVLAFQVNI